MYIVGYSTYINIANLLIYFESVLEITKHTLLIQNSTIRSMGCIYISKYIMVSSENFYNYLIHPIKMPCAQSLVHILSLFWWQRLATVSTDIFCSICLSVFHMKSKQVFGAWRGSKQSIEWKPGGRLNKKDGLTRYGHSHVKDKTS